MQHTRLTTFAFLFVLALATCAAPAAASADTELENARHRYAQLVEQIEDLDARLDEAHARYARAQQREIPESVEQIQDQIRALSIRRDTDWFEQTTLLSRYGDEIRPAPASGDGRTDSIAGQLSNGWRARKVAQARLAVVDDLRRLFK